MPKYIDVDQIDWIKITVPMLDGMLVHTKELDGVYALREAVDAMPAADVEEVKRGKWLPYRFGLGVAKCSICGAVYDGGDSFRFCPKCGAKMDLKG